MALEDVVESRSGSTPTPTADYAERDPDVIDVEDPANYLNVNAAELDEAFRASVNKFVARERSPNAKRWRLIAHLITVTLRTLALLAFVLSVLSGIVFVTLPKGWESGSAGPAGDRWKWCAAASKEHGVLEVADLTEVAKIEDGAQRGRPIVIRKAVQNGQKRDDEPGHTFLPKQNPGDIEELAPNTQYDGIAIAKRITKECVPFLKEADNNERDWECPFMRALFDGAVVDGLSRVTERRIIKDAEAVEKKQRELESLE